MALALGLELGLGIGLFTTLPVILARPGPCSHGGVTVSVRGGRGVPEAVAQAVDEARRLLGGEGAYLAGVGVGVGMGVGVFVGIGVGVRSGVELDKRLGVRGY